MAFFSVTFAPELDADLTVERALVRSVLASLVFEGAVAVTLLDGMHKFTVRRIQRRNVTHVLVDAVLPDEDGELTAYRLCHTNRRLGVLFGPDSGRQSSSHHLIRFGEGVLNLATAAVSAKSIHDLPLSGTMRWRWAEGDVLVPPRRPRRKGPRQ